MGKSKYFSTVAVRDGVATDVWHHLRRGASAEKAAILEMQITYPAQAILLDPLAQTLKGARVRLHRTERIKWR